MLETGIVAMKATCVHVYEVLPSIGAAHDGDVFSLVFQPRA